MKSVDGQHKAELVLGIEGFNYGDLYKPQRLRDLLDVFDREAANRDSTLFAEF